MARRGFDTIQLDRLLERIPYQILLISSGKTDEIEKEKISSKVSVWKVPSYSDSSSLEYALMTFSRKRIINAICCTSEKDITRAAILREALGVRGQLLDSACAFRDKIYMKEILSEAGLPIPSFAHCKSITDIHRFMEKQPLPLVVKPIDADSSKEVIFIRKEEDLKKIAYIPGFFDNKGWDVEEFVDGVVFHIDGLTKDREILVAWPSQYVNQCVDCLSGRWFGSYFLHPKDPRTSPLIKFSHSVIQALPNTAGSAFHLEVFMKPNNEIVFLEIASRPGGGVIRQSWIENFGIDLIEQHIFLQAGLNSDGYRKTPKNQTGFVILYSKGGTVREASNFPSDNSIFFTDLWLQAGDVIEAPTDLSSASGLVGFKILDKENPESEVRSWADKLSGMYIID